MPSRLWLFIAFVIAFGSEPAQAETASKMLAVVLDQATVAKLPPPTSTRIDGNPMVADGAAKILAVVLDQATVAELPPRTSTLIVGNPMIADVTMLKTGAAMVVTGKGYGQTNLIGLDDEGRVLLDEQLRVLPPKTVVVLQNGTSHVSYSCNPDCMPTAQLGDDPKSFNEVGGQISSRNGYALGSGGGK
jgi:Flp pilus assembly secretin CpaC